MITDGINILDAIFMQFLCITNISHDLFITSQAGQFLLHCWSPQGSRLEPIVLKNCQLFLPELPKNLPIVLKSSPIVSFTFTGSVNNIII